MDKVLNGVVFLCLFVSTNSFSAVKPLPHSPLECSVSKSNETISKKVDSIIVDRNNNETSPPIVIAVGDLSILAFCAIAEEQRNEQITCGFIQGNRDLTKSSTTVPFLSPFLASTLLIDDQELMIYCFEESNAD